MNDETMFNGNGLIILILFFLMSGFGGGFGGYGNARYAENATTTQLYEATNNQMEAGALAGIKETINAGIYENAKLINDAKYHDLQNTNAISLAMNNGFDSVTAQIANLGSMMQSCCCDIKTQMLQDKYDAVRYQLEQANTAVANAVQTQNILSSLGKFYQNPPYFPYPYWRLTEAATEASAVPTA